jgi:transaldolase
VGIGPVSRRAVFLDRDGVLTRAVVRDGVPHPPPTLEGVEILPGVEGALEMLHDLGFLLIGVTNQPDVARGTQTIEVVEAINRHLLDRLPLLEILVCPHDDRDGCGCRKPKPGLLTRAAARHGIDLSRSFMVGDMWRDVGAGRAAGCWTLLVEAPYNRDGRCRPDEEVSDLLAAARRIASGPGSPPGPGKGAREVASPTLEGLRIRIFADGVDKAGMVELARRPYISGFTTNPTLMRRAGITDYRAFAREILDALPGRPISFEVLSDDFEEMERQAREIGSWGRDVYVKVPVTNTRGEPASALIRRLSRDGIKLNVTALLTLEQVRDVSEALGDGAPSCISVFAGRIADTGRDPVPLMAAAVALMRPYPSQSLLWASPREVLNIFQADAAGCHIITVTHDLLARLDGVGKDLGQFSLDTVRMFYEDGRAAGYRV